MRMKVVLVTILSVFLLSSAAWAIGPDLVGPWNGTTTEHTRSKGFITAMGNTQWIVTEVKDGAFTGKKVWKHHTSEQREEAFSGVISADGKKLYIAEHEDGVLIGDVISPRKIVLYYMESGPKAKAQRIELTRSK